MDLSLWDPPVVQVAADSNSCNWNDWYCDFHFGYGRDVIEEDALNETSCMQVRKILKAKTDDEVMQHEGDSSAIETSLASPNTELSKLCSVDRDGTECFEKSIQLRKDEHDEHDSGLQLHSHTEAAGGVHETIKGLLCKDLEQKTDQCRSGTVSIPSVLAGVVGKKKVMSENSEAPESEKRIKDFHSLDKGVKQNPHDRPQQNMIKFTELASAPRRSPFQTADDAGLQKVVRRFFDTETEETKKVSDSPHNDEMEDPSTNPPQQKMEGILESNGYTSSRSSIENILEASSAMVSGEDLENTDGKYDSELEVKGLSSSSSKGGREVNCSKTCESKHHTRALIKDVNENPVEKEAASIVGCATEVREKSVVSMPSSDAKVASSDIRSKTEAPVCFAEDSCRMQDRKRSQTARQKKESRKKPALSQQKKMETDSLLQIKGNRKSYTELKPISVDTLIELINGRNNGNRPQKKVKGKLQASLKEPEAFLPNVSIKKEYSKLKRKHLVKLETVEQSLPEESGFNLAALEMVKIHKSESAELNGFNATNITKEEESSRVGTKLADGSLTSITTPATYTPNSNIKSSVLPPTYENEDSSDLQIVPAKMHDIMMKIKLEDSAEIPSCDSRVEIPGESLSVSDLQLMTLVKLKDMARRNNLKGFNKLKKARLVSFLAKELKLGSSDQ